MSFNLPKAMVQEQQAQAALAQAQFNKAVAHVLSHGNVGEWSSDHTQESKSFSGWNYLAIAAIGRQAARAHHYVYSDEPAQSAARTKAKAKYGGIWKALAQDGAADAVPDDHWVAKQVAQPNANQDGAMFRWEYIQQMHLHGACIIWNRPTEDGTRTAARYIIPIAMSQPVYAGQDKTAPNGGVRIESYLAGLGFYVHPLLRRLAGSVIPIESLSIVRYPHPVMRGDGRSPTDAAGWWIDTAQMIDETRWRQLKAGPGPSSFIKVEGDVSPQQLDDLEKRVNRKIDDDYYRNKAMAIPNAELDKNTPPVNMEYVSSFDQIGQAILAAHGIGKSLVGLTDNMTFGSNAAAMQMANMVVQGDLDMLAGEWTALAKLGGANVSVEFETQPIDDPAVIEQQLQTDITAGIRTGREVRALRGLPPFGDWRDDARVTSTGLVVDEPTPPKKREAPPQPQFGGSFEEGLATLPFARSLTKSIGAAAKPKRAPVVAIDLDGTLAEYDGYSPDSIGEPIAEAVEVAHRLHEAGCQIVIFTCREDNEQLRGWLDSAGVPYDGINESSGVAAADMLSGKVMADVYWDDRAVSVEDGLAGIAAKLPEVYRAKLTGEKPAGDDVGCVMLELPPRISQRVLALQGAIPPERLTGDGLEDWPHVTLLWGIVGASIQEVIEAVRRLPVMELEIGPAGFFHGDERSVLKLAVQSTELMNANRKLAAALPNEQTFPEYRPHVTLAYVANEPAEYPSRELNSLRGEVFEVDTAVLDMDGRQVRIPLRKVYSEQHVVADKPKTATVDRLLAPVAKSYARPEYRDVEQPDIAKCVAEAVSATMTQILQTLVPLLAAHQPKPVPVPVPVPVVQPPNRVAKALAKSAVFADAHELEVVPEDAQQQQEEQRVNGNGFARRNLFDRLASEPSGNGNGAEHKDDDAVAVVDEPVVSEAVEEAVSETPPDSVTIEAIEAESQPDPVVDETPAEVEPEAPAAEPQSVESGEDAAEGS